MKSTTQRKAPWTLAFPDQLAKLNQRKVIKKAERKSYASEAKEFLTKHSRCGVVGCGKKSVHIHHTRGRVGTLRRDQSFWMPVCWTCHNRIHKNVAWAISQGYLPVLGEWNKPAKHTP